MAAEPRHDAYDDELPDPRLVWRWVGRATRPVIGWVLVGVGAFFVLLGWFGVSREAVVAKQIPYIVSGGIAGVLLAVIGAYFLATEEMRKDSGRLDRLERMVEDLHRTLLQVAPGAVNAPAPEEEVSTNGAGLVALAGSDLFHRAGCEMVEGKGSAHTITAAMARRRKLAPCPVCEPAPLAAIRR